MLADISKTISEAKAKGHTVEVRHAKVMICGSSATGKTNFVNLLLGDKFVSIHNATVVTAAKDTMVKKIFISENNENLVEFKKCDLDYQISILKSHLYHKQYKYASSNVHNHKDLLASTRSTGNSRSLEINEGLVIQEFEEDTDAEKDVEVKGYIVDDQLHEYKESGINSSTLPVSNIFSPEELEDSAYGHRSDIEKQLTEVRKDIEKLPKTWDMLTFLDTGGQPEYISMLPAVNCSVMITFVVLSLEYDLSQNVAVFKGDGEEEKRTDLLSYDYSTFIKMLVSMRKPKMEMVPDEVIAKKAEKSYLSFIGTKSDIVTEKHEKNLDDVVDNFDKELQKHLAAGLPDVLTFVDGKYLTAVSNCNAGEISEDNNAKRIRIKLYEKLQESAAVYNIPITWLLLELEIKRWCLKYMTLQEIKRLCAELNLLESSMTILINF